MMWCSMALNRATSVPGSICRWMSASSASSIRRTSATISLAPLATARLISAPNTGWVSVVFAPAMKMTSHASSISRMEPEAAAVLSARFIAETEVEWQSRVQWSTLLVRNAASDHPHEGVVVLVAALGGGERAQRAWARVGPGSAGSPGP